MKTPLISIGSELSEHIFNKNENRYINPVVIRLIDCLVEYEEIDTISSYHPLGFIHINIPSGSDLSGIRFHIWPNDIEVDRTPINIHDHYYDLHSYVMCGKIQNNIYNVEPNANGSFVVYKGVYNLDKTERTLVKSNLIVNCSIIESSIIEAGNYYFIDRNDFHNSIVNDFTSTIVLINNYKNKSEPKVVGRIDSPSVLDFPKHHIKKNEIVKNLLKVKDSLEN